jgi:mannose-6-phosphate isomerase-like protein (cupin superfamily)
MISKATAQHYLWGANCDGWHLVQHATLSVIQERMPPGAAEVMHYHQQARQFFFILSGTATFEIEGREETFGPQQGIEVPPSTPHCIRNAAQTDLEFLVISQPPSHGDRINLQFSNNR